MLVSGVQQNDSVHGLFDPGSSLCPWDSPGKSTGAGCHALLQGVFPTQGATPGLLHCRQILYLWAIREAHFLQYHAVNVPFHHGVYVCVCVVKFSKITYFEKNESFNFQVIVDSHPVARNNTEWSHITLVHFLPVVTSCRTISQSGYWCWCSQGSIIPRISHAALV